MLADVSVDLVIDVRVPSRRGWMSGSGGVGVTGIVSAVIRGLVVHVLWGAGEEWRCGRCVVVTRWRGSESCPLGFMLVVGKVMCLASGSTGEDGLADVALGVRAFGCTVVSAAVGAGVCILGG